MLPISNLPVLYKSEDWALFLQIIKACKDCYAYTEEPLAYYCLRSDSLSSNKLSMIKYNLAVYQEILGYNLIKAYAAFLLCFIPSYFLKIMRRKIDSYRYLKKHSSFIQKWIRNTVTVSLGNMNVIWVCLL